MRCEPLQFRATVAGILAVAGFAAASPVRAATQLAECRGPLLLVEDTVGSEWGAAVEAARARLRKNDDLDRCAALRIDWADDGLRITVTTADGRAALRKVSAPERLVPTLEALVVLPPLATTPSAPDSSDPPGEATGGQPERVPPEVPRRAAHLEVGVGATGRIAGAPLYGGAGLASFAQLEMDRWLVGVSARWEAIDDTLALPSPPGFNMQTFEVGVGIGRRAIVGQLGLDAVLGPEVIVESQEAEGPADGLGGTASDVRIDLLLRISVPRSGPTRFYTSADADVSPSRVRRTKQLDSGLPALPAWSTGLQLGVVWGAL